MLLLMLLVLLVELVELVVDEGSRSGISLTRLGMVASWLAVVDTGVDPGITVTGAVVILGLSHQIESADDENLNNHSVSQSD